jgi:hypothetical protein
VRVQGPPGLHSKTLTPKQNGEDEWILYFQKSKRNMEEKEKAPPQRRTKTQNKKPSPSPQ